MLSLIAILLLFAAPVAAQEENRAGLVIVHGDGSMVTQCIAFAEESIGGAELLARSKFDLSMEASSMGATICRIDGEGCDFPADTCFCQCQGSPCIYWSYWRLTEGEWRYSNIGAGNAVVRHGNVDGWRWGQGTVDKAEPPFAITFEDICVEPIRASEPMPAAVGAGDEERPSAAPSLQAVSSQAVSSQAVSSQAVASQAVASQAVASQAVAPETVAASSANQPVGPDTTPTPLSALGMVLGALVILPIAALLLVWLRSASKERGR